MLRPRQLARRLKALVDRLGDELVDKLLHVDGKQLADEHTSCELWQSAPFDDNPNKTMAQKRFFLYHNIAKLLGVNGLNKRARLPSCVYKRIKELYPDPEGLPTKVGFKRARA